MRPTYTIDLEQGCVFVKWIGDVTAEDIIAFKDELKQDPDHRWGLNRLVDLRQAKLRLPNDKIRRMILQNVVRHDAIEGHRKAAMLVGRDREFGDSRVMHAMSDPTDTEIRPFRQLDEALAWLELPEVLDDPFETMSQG